MTPRDKNQNQWIKAAYREADTQLNSARTFSLNSFQ